MSKRKSKSIIGIVEWLERYEVSSKGREPKPGEELRAGRLLFIRLKVYGHTQSTGYRRLQSVAGDKTMEVFGFFCKFLEISGNQKREYRGILLNEKNQPASPEDLAFILGVPLDQVENAIKVLSDEKVGWIIYNRKPNTTQLNTTQHNTSIPENPEIPGKSGKGALKRFKKPTPAEVKAYGKSIGYATDGHEFVNWYESKGWMVGKNKMVDWRAAVRTWKDRKRKENAQHGSEKTGGDNTPPEPFIR